MAFERTSGLRGPQAMRSLGREESSMITLDHFKQMDLRIGEVLSVAPHPQADRLLVLRVQVGDSERTLVAGIRDHYQESELVGKKVVVVTNLVPASIRGVLSEGMILAASNEKMLTLLVPDRPIESGAKVS